MTSPDKQAVSGIAGIPSAERFFAPAHNDARGLCTHCGRDNSGYEGEPCIDDCPQYWEAQGIPHPQYGGAA